MNTYTTFSLTNISQSMAEKIVESTLSIYFLFLIAMQRYGVISDTAIPRIWYFLWQSSLLLVIFRIVSCSS